MVLLDNESNLEQEWLAQVGDPSTWATLEDFNEVLARLREAGTEVMVCQAL